MSIAAVALRRTAFEAYLLVALGSTAAARARWSKAGFPTLVEVSVLEPLLDLLGLDRATLLANNSAPVALEAADGNWRPAMDALAGAPSDLGSVEASAAAFDREVAPLARQSKTRSKHWAAWRTVLTWAAARECLPRIMPMDLVVLKAFLWDALSFGLTTPVLRGILNSVQARHHDAGLPSPLVGAHAYTQMVKTLSRFQGQQRQWLYPIHKTLVARMLRHEPKDHHDWRDLLAAAVATICCLRPNEGGQLQVCDLWYEWDARSHAPGMEGTAALNISVRKNDPGRKGLHPRMGRARDPALDVVFQLRDWLSQTGVRPHSSCSKMANPSARCPRCPPLFPASNTARTAFALDRRTSPAAFSAMIVHAIAVLGLDTSAFTGVCARRGGLSTAIEAGVPEVILWMQSGHAQDKAARVYVALSSTTLLYDTWRAFGL